MLQVEYPADKDQQFGLAIVEPDATGVAEGIQRDVGVYVEGLGRSEAQQRQTHRVLFWPRTQSPLLVVTNRDRVTAAHFGLIRVFRQNGIQNVNPKPVASNRIVATYLSRPLASETFGTTKAMITLPGGTNAAVDDDQSFYDAATRLAEYVRYGGYNAAVVSVMADGSSIFPCTQLSPTPRYDAGRRTERLQDADGLELALQVFDRENLTFIPALEFATPLPNLELLRRASDPRLTGVELVGVDGRTWLETYGSRDGLAPYYNLLDPRVQQAILAIVRETVNRYGRHRSFGGLAINLTSDGYTQLPPLEWALDDATISRFEQATGITIAATGPERFAARYEVLSSQYKDQWRAWRAAQVAEFYRRMTEIVRGNNDHQLLLTTERLFDHPQIRERIRPSLTNDNRVAAAMVDLGLDRQLLAQVPGLTFCPVQYLESTKPLQDRAADLEVNAAMARGTLPAGFENSSGALIFHRAQKSRFASMAAPGGVPFKMGDRVTLASQPLPFGVSSRAPYLRALSLGSPAAFLEGGDLLPMAQDHVLSGIRATIGELPREAQVSEIEASPVIVRTYREAGQTTILVMNTSPWTTKAKVSLQLTRDVLLEPLGMTSESASDGRGKPISLAAGLAPWEFTLQPYDVRAVRVPIADAKAMNVQAEVSKAGRAELQWHIADLSNRDLSAPRTYTQLVNPSFEPLGVGIAGWRLTSDPAKTVVSLDATVKQDGKASLYLRSDGAVAVVKSDPFPVPATGQLMMTVYTRAKFGADTTLTLYVETEGDGTNHEIKRTANAALLKPPANEEWRQVAFDVPELPLQSQSKMRIRFELSGQGEVWLDNVKLFDLLFPLKYYKNSQSELLQLFKVTHAAQTAYQNQQIRECLQIRDGYWMQFIGAYTVPLTPKLAAAPAPAGQAAPPPGAGQPKPNEQPAPGISDRIKRMVPIWR
jgi:hypothetical protein